MKVIITENYDEMSKKAFEVMKEVIVSNPNAVLGLATGSSPVGLYKNMAKAYENGEISFRHITSVNLDEYVGIPVTHPQSYHTFMYENLFRRINIDLTQTDVPNGEAADMEQACKDYSKILSKKIPDVQVLGLGENGHIGFNEPYTPFDSDVHTVELTASTREANKRFFKSLDEVPTHAITMGIGNIMKAKKVLMVVSGEKKADAVYAMIKGPVDVKCPASVLQNHPDCIVVLDKAAASKL